MASPDFIIESRIITFVDQESVTVTFAKSHYGIPVVCVMPTFNTRLLLSSITSTSCVIEASNKISGNVHFQAISKLS